MACHMGEPVSGSAGGWLGRRSKLWRLPFTMHPMAEVCSLPAYFPLRMTGHCRLLMALL